jgi:hypothetical protein
MKVGACVRRRRRVVHVFRDKDNMSGRSEAKPR